MWLHSRDESPKILSMNEDQITELERLQSAVLLARGTFHQLGNHLTLINGYSSLVRMNAEPGSEDAELMGRIDRAVKEMSSLLDDTHAFMRARLTEASRVDVGHVLEEGCSLMARTFPRLRLELSLPDERVFARIPRRHLGDALMHICLNSMDAMGGQGTVRVGLGKTAPDSGDRLPASLGDPDPDRMAVICIEDEGPGFPPSVLDADPTPGPGIRREDGQFRSGLGLCAVQSILAGHSGAMQIDNSPGGGGRVMLYLIRDV